MITDLSPSGIAERKTWIYRILHETANRENAILHYSIRAFCSVGENRLPRAGRKAIINKQGIVLFAYHHKDGKVEIAEVNNVTKMTDDLRRLCDKCKFTDEERQGLFNQFKQWIFRDERATSNLQAATDFDKWNMK